MNNRKRRNEEGQGLVEYALVMVLVSVVVIAILTVLGPTISNVYCSINTALGGQCTSSVADDSGDPVCYNDQVCQAGPLGGLEYLNRGASHAEWCAAHPGGGFYSFRRWDGTNWWYVHGTNSTSVGAPYMQDGDTGTCPG